MRKRIDLAVLLLSLSSVFVLWKWGMLNGGNYGIAQVYWNYILGIGILFSFVLYAMVYALASAQSRAENLAKQMLFDLRKYKQALDSTYTHAIITDTEGTVIYANKAVEKTTGYPLSEVIGQNPRLWGRQMNISVYQKLWHTIKDEKKVYRGDVTNRRKDGTRYVAKATISPIIDDKGILVGFVGVEEDVTDERAHAKETEKMINDRTGQLLAVINSIGRGLIVVDRDKNIVLQNKSAKHILGVVGEIDWDQISKFVGEKLDLEEILTKSFEMSEVTRVEPILFGSRFLNFHFVPVIDSNNKIGKLEQVAIFIKDVTEVTNLNRSRDEFFSIASHELRTPLTAIRGNASMILDNYSDKLGGGETVEMVKDIYTGSVRLIEIVNDFLNVSRLEMGKIDFKTETIDLNTLINKTIDELRLGYQKEGLEIVSQIQDGGPLVHGDSDRLSQVIINLVGNAVKFTQAGKITISSEVHGQEVWVLVSDTGNGIDPKMQGILFHKFQQAGDSLYTRDTSKGTGLGLYISKLIIEGMKGRIWLKNSEVGKGSTFAFSLKKV